jgi:hypothetical protein
MKSLSLKHLILSLSLFGGACAPPDEVEGSDEDLTASVYRLQVDVPDDEDGTSLLERTDIRELRFKIVGPNKRVVSKFEPLHGETVHLVVHSLQNAFLHLHPKVAADGTLTVPFSPKMFRSPDKSINQLPETSRELDHFAFYAEFQEAGSNAVQVARLQLLASTEAVAHCNEGGTGDFWKETFGNEPVKMRVRPNTQSCPAGKAPTLTASVSPESWDFRNERYAYTTLSKIQVDVPQAPAQLENWLQMPAHGFLLSRTDSCRASGNWRAFDRKCESARNKRDFLHLHAESMQANASGGTTLTFELHHPITLVDSFYSVVVQYKVRGESEPRTVSADNLTAERGAPEPAISRGGHHH